MRQPSEAITKRVKGTQLHPRKGWERKREKRQIVVDLQYQFLKIICSFHHVSVLLVF